MRSSNSEWLLPLTFAAALVVGACKDTNDEPEPEIASMRVVVSPTGGAQQTITVARTGCARTGNPITLAINTTTPITVSFLNAAGQPDAIANDAAKFKVAGTTTGTTTAAEPVPTPSTIVWARTGNFAGTLRGSAATTTGSVTLSALHISEGHADFECPVAITVQ